MADDRVNILLVDDQPAKLLSYEVMLDELGENLLKANSAREALETLLKCEVAVVLMDVSMPELDGFELAAMIREHPRYRQTAIIFVSAVHLSEVDFLRGYQMGGVDYVSVPVVPQVLRAKVRVFAELYRKTRQLELLNAGLEARVAERTAALEDAAGRLTQSEQRRTLALAAGQMGSWDWDVASGDVHFDEGQYGILGVVPDEFPITIASLRAVIHPADFPELERLLGGLAPEAPACQAEFRVQRGDGEQRWFYVTAAATIAPDGRMLRVSGVTMDVTDRKRWEEQQALLVREVDHRAKNVLAVVQSIVRLSKADSAAGYMATIDGRIQALSRVHGLLAGSRWQGADLQRLAEDEFSPYTGADVRTVRLDGPTLWLDPGTAQTVGMALHELSTNAAKYGALSAPGGSVVLSWEEAEGQLRLTWREDGGPVIVKPKAIGFGLRVIARSIEGQLGGRAAFDWRREGLSCVLSMPLHAAGAKPPPRHAGNGGKIAASPTAARNVLLVEDEALVGIMLADILSGMGYEVVGPLASVAEALGPAEEANLQVALLDVTLRGERIYRVAHILKNRGIPFAFLTGYSRDAIDGQFAAVPVLQKPVDEAALQSFLASTVTPGRPGALARDQRRSGRANVPF